MGHRTPERVIWHDVECASYGADLPLWRELAAGARGPILDVGSGTGRVTLDLAQRGHDMHALDADSAFTDAVAERARERGLRVHTYAADARTFEIPGTTFALAIAPMQVLQLLGSVSGRTAAIERVRDHLRPGGQFAVALADPFLDVPEEELGPPIPDVREQDGWVFQSMPIAVRAVPGGNEIDRIRQAVSPTGELDESFNTIRLDDVTPDDLERDGIAAGMRVRPRREVPPTGDYVGSTIVMLERP
jgi:SAM-dependent methyltransferase